MRGSDIGLIVQNPRASLHPLHTVGAADRRVCRRISQVTAHEAWRARGRPCCASLGINDPERRAHAYPHEICGGMAQRVLIAMALGVGPAPADRRRADQRPRRHHPGAIPRPAVGDARKRRLRRAADDAGSRHHRELLRPRGRHAEGGRVVDSDDARVLRRTAQDGYSRTVLALRKERRRPPTAGRRAAARRSRPDARPFRLRGSSKTRPGRRPTSTSRSRRGETLGLVGESGSGKTTVGRCLLRLSSRTRARSCSTARHPSPRQRRPRCARCARKLQIVFQDPFDSLDPRWTVADIIAEADSTATAATDAPRRANCWRLVGSRPGVARRKAARASAPARSSASTSRARIATEPDLIVLDEPTSALTPLARVDDHPSAARPAGAARPVLSLHLARPQDGRASEPPRGGDVSRPDRRDRQHASRFSSARAIPTPGRCSPRISSPTPSRRRVDRPIPDARPAKFRARSTCRAAATSPAAARRAGRLPGRSRRRCFAAARRAPRPLHARRSRRLEHRAMH